MLLALAFAATLASCTAQQMAETPKIDPKLGVSASARVVAEGENVPRGGGRYQVGDPYKVAGKWYSPKEDPDYDEVGLASWYGANFHGRLTANGEVFDSAALSAAHPTLPLPSYVRVTNLANSASVIVRVNDRGPFAHGRLIDVSEQAADMLGFRRTGTAKVRVEYVDVAKLDGDDENFLMASYHPPSGRPADGGTMLAMASAPKNPAPRTPRSPAPPPVADSPTVAFADAGGSEAAAQAVSALTATYSPEDRIAMSFTLFGEN